MIQDRAERTMARHYQVTVKEYLEDSWAAWFDGLAISHAPDRAATLAQLPAIRPHSTA